MRKGRLIKVPTYSNSKTTWQIQCEVTSRDEEVPEMVVACSTTLPQHLLYTKRISEEVTWPTEPDSQQTAIWSPFRVPAAVYSHSWLPNLSLWRCQQTAHKFSINCWLQHTIGRAAHCPHTLCHLCTAQRSASGPRRHSGCVWSCLNKGTAVGEPVSGTSGR